MANWFKQYRILARLKRGRRTENYLVISPQFEQLLVLSRLLPNAGTKVPGLHELLSQSLDSIASMNNPVLGDIIEHGAQQQVFYWVRPFVSGRSLHYLLRKQWETKKFMPLNAVAYVMDTLLQIFPSQLPIDSISPSSFKHIFELFPRHILIGYEGIVNCVDLGIGCWLSRQTPSDFTLIKGRDPYLAPETCELNDINEAGTFFSLGTLFFELLTNRRLFWSSDPKASISSFKGIDAQKLKDFRGEIPDTWADLLEGLLHPIPQQRLTDIEHVREVISQYLDKQAQQDLGDFIQGLCNEEYAKDKAVLEKYLKELDGLRQEENEQPNHKIHAEQDDMEKHEPTALSANPFTFENTSAPEQIEFEPSIIPDKMLQGEYEVQEDSVIVDINSLLKNTNHGPVTHDKETVSLSAPIPKAIPTVTLAPSPEQQVVVPSPPAWPNHFSRDHRALVTKKSPGFGFAGWSVIITAGIVAVGMMVTSYLYAAGLGPFRP